MSTLQPIPYDEDIPHVLKGKQNTGNKNDSSPDWVSWYVQKQPSQPNQSTNDANQTKEHENLFVNGVFNFLPFSASTIG